MRWMRYGENYTKIVYKCTSCNNSDTCGLTWYCKVKRRKRIPNPETIPDWCPLEDAKPEEIKK